MSHSAPGPTILAITYQVPTDVAATLESWIAQARASAARAPGFLGAGMDTTFEPTSLRIIASYKFDSDETLDAFLASPGWLAVQAERPAELLGIPLESRSKEGGSTRAAEVITASVPASRLEDYQRRRANLDAKAGEFPGFASVDVYEPPTGQDTWTTVLTFDSSESLGRWRDSSERAALVASIREVADDEDRVIPTGFGQWFSVNATATAQAPAWKQAMVVVAVLYAMVSVLNMTLGNFVGAGLQVEGERIFSGLGLPFPVVVFIGNAVGTVLLSWVLMPIVTRVMAWWLNPAATRAQTVRGVIVMLIVYVVEIALFVWIFRTFSF